MSTILVVEDDPTMRKLWRNVLEPQGHFVVEAIDKQDADAWLETQQPDLVLIDLTLPDGSGTELASELRETAGLQAAAVIAISGSAPGLEQARNGGDFDELLLKPVGTAKLSNVVDHWLALRRPGAARHHVRVLVVDEEPVVLKLTKVQLEGLGFDVECADNGTSELELTRRSPLDGIYSDGKLDLADEFELCEEMRSDHDPGKVPVVVISADHAPEADRQHALDLGANAYLFRNGTPSVNLEGLLAALKASLPPGA